MSVCEIASVVVYCTTLGEVGTPSMAEGLVNLYTSWGLTDVYNTTSKYIRMYECEIPFMELHSPLSGVGVLVL